MALDRIYAKTNETFFLPTATGKKSGDPYAVGQIPVVLATDAAAATPYGATCFQDGVFNLKCQAESTDIAAGTILYYDDDDSTTKLTNDSSGNVRFGYALDALTVGNSPATIRVQLGY